MVLSSECLHFIVESEYCHVSFMNRHRVVGLDSDRLEKELILLLKICIFITENICEMEMVLADPALLLTVQIPLF